jgi:hypothetical protein
MPLNRTQRMGTAAATGDSPLGMSPRGMPTLQPTVLLVGGRMQKGLREEGIHRRWAGSTRDFVRLPGSRLLVPAARGPQWLNPCQRLRPTCTRGTYFLAALRSEWPTNWENAALRQAFARNRVPCVHMGWAFWHPPTREGRSCLKSRPACTRGMHFLTAGDRQRVARVERMGPGAGLPRGLPRSTWLLPLPFFDLRWLAGWRRHGLVEGWLRSHDGGHFHRSP